MKIKITFIITSLLATVFTSCDKNLGNSRDVFTQLYSVDNLPTLTFDINTERDTSINTEYGIKFFIPKNCFVDSFENLVNGNIKIEVKEAMKPADFVLGNLTTTSDNKTLQSGGMFYIQATLNGSNLSINKDKSIDVSVPSQNKFPDMLVFEGQKDSSSINWNNPLPLQANQKKDSIAYEVLKTNVKYSVEGFADHSNYPDTVDNVVSQIAWSKSGRIITKDSTFKIGKYKVTFYKQSKLDTMSFVSFFNGPTNAFQEDNNTNYIFSIKKLGWANIDRFYQDVRTKEVELVTNIENNNEFNLVYVTLICSNQNMYLPGYQKKDNSYSFTHGDYEKANLPIGESMTILATAYKDNKPFFAYKKIVVSEKQTINLKVEEITKDELKKKLEKEI